MTKRKTGLAIGLAVTCIAALCATGACNGIGKEEKTVLPAATTSTTAIITTAPPNTSATATTTGIATTAETTAVTTTATQITTAVTCSATEQGLGEMPPLTTAEQTTIADTTVQQTTTSTTATTTAPVPTEPYHGQTSGDYIYVNGFGWVFNEGGGGYGETNHEMYCNGNKIGYFG